MASDAHDNMQLEDIQFETAAARLHHYPEDWHHTADDNALGVEADVVSLARPSARLLTFGWPSTQMSVGELRVWLARLRLMMPG